MKVHFGFGYGMGDVSSHFFSPVNYHKRNEKAFMLGRIRNGVRSGVIHEAVAVRVQHWSDWNWCDLFGNLDFPLRCWNGTARELDAYLNCWDHPTAEFLAIPDTVCTLPEEYIEVPDKYILFHDVASQRDRCLTDPTIVLDLKKRGLPIVRTGRGNVGQFDVDVDYGNRTSLPELFYLARRAELIVSACTFQRCFGRIFHKPVIEVGELERISPVTLDRTYGEYRDGQYGMSPTWNRFIKYPSQEWERFVHIA